jgi:hypothetical protein
VVVVVGATVVVVEDGASGLDVGEGTGLTAVEVVELVGVVVLVVLVVVALVVVVATEGSEPAGAATAPVDPVIETASMVQRKAAAEGHVLRMGDLTTRPRPTVRGWPSPRSPDRR